MSHQSIEIPQEIIDANENLDRVEPSTLRIFRESLGLSRSDVEDHTGLASSVVWRSEQDNRHVPDEAYAAIYNFLTYVRTAGRPSCCGRRSGKAKAKASQVASSDTKTQERLASLMVENAKLQEALDAANIKADLLGSNAAKLHATGVALQEKVEILESQLNAANMFEPLEGLSKFVQREIDQARLRKASTASLKRVLDYINQ